MKLLTRYKRHCWSRALEQKLGWGDGGRGEGGGEGGGAKSPPPVFWSSKNPVSDRLNLYYNLGKLRQLSQYEGQSSTWYLFTLIYIVIIFPLYACVKLRFDPTERIWENFVPAKWDPLQHKRHLVFSWWNFSQVIAGYNRVHSTAGIPGNQARALFREITITYSPPQYNFNVTLASFHIISY